MLTLLTSRGRMQSWWRGSRLALAHTGAALTALSLTACTSASKMGQSRWSDEPAFATASYEVRDARQSASVRQIAADANDTESGVIHADSRVDASRHRDENVQLVNGGRPASETVFASQECPAPGIGVTSSAPCPRVPLTVGDACPTGCPPTSPCYPGTALDHYPDEYLCDGGDRDLPVHYEGSNIAGLETEDTIVEFRDSDGKRRVRPSNKTCIYSPRFAAFSSITGASEDLAANQPFGAQMVTLGGKLQQREVVFAHNQRKSALDVRTRSSSQGYGMAIGSETVFVPLVVVGHEQVQSPFIDLGVVRTGTYEASQEPVLALGIQAANEWSRQQNPAIQAALETGTEVRATATTADFAGDDRVPEPGRLRIIKLADRDQAKPGDIVKFTIRYDNLGGKDVSNVTIVDNLTPRLEYVDESATSDRPGQLGVQDNEQGSVILSWVIDAPIPGRQGGVITFEARVR